MQVGDIVARYLGDGKKFMNMRVLRIDKEKELVHCAAIDKDTGAEAALGWTFDLRTGAEVDEDLEWGPRWGITGSYIKKEE